MMAVLLTVSHLSARHSAEGREVRENIAGRLNSFGLRYGLWGLLDQGVEEGERKRPCIRTSESQFQELETEVQDGANLVGGCLRGAGA